MHRILILLLALPLLAQAQNRELLHFGLKADLEKADEGATIPVYLRGEVDGIVSFVREEGGQVKGTFQGVVSARLPVAAFAKIGGAEAVHFVEYHPWGGEALSDVVLLNNNVTAVHDGLAPLPDSYRGKDVILGIIDTGIELDHPDFQHEDGSTRVIALWDQVQSETDPQRVPQPYGYGQEYTAEDLDAGISNHDDQSQYFGHGSTVSGVAVGNANATGDFLGVAPEADIIVVSSNFSAPNWTMTVAEAVEWIFARADAIGKPAVINASLGSYLGSHDALDASALHIDSLLEAAPGRAMVCAAGNSNAWAPYHLSYEVPETDTAFTWFAFNPNALDNGAVFFEVWADAADFDNTSFTIGADVVSPSYAFRGYAGWRNAAQNLNQLITDTIFFNGAIIGRVQSWMGQRGDQYVLQIAVTQPFSSQYRWRFATTGGGRFSCWSRAAFGMSDIVSTNLPSTAAYPAMASYRMPDKLTTMVDSWACSDKVLTVANYVNQTSFENYSGGITTYDNATAGDLSPNSSSGPTRDLRQKPDVASTGDVVLSAGRLATLTSFINNNPGNVAFSGMHYVNGGTSMASPVVAAAAALLFERCPNATYAEIHELITANAMADEFTGELPGVRFGHGKLDVFSTLLATVSPVAISAPTPLCPGQPTMLLADPGFFDYEWSTGSAGIGIVVSDEGPYSVQARDGLGCLQESGPFWVDFLDAPEAPAIVANGDMLEALGDADAWQWYLDEVAIAGATDASLVPAVDGFYTVEAIGENGCGTLSEPFAYGLVDTADQGAGEFSLFPNPASDWVRLRVAHGFDALRIFDVQGRLVQSLRTVGAPGVETEISVSGIPAGLYLLTFESEGQTHKLKIAIGK